MRPLPTPVIVAAALAGLACALGSSGCAETPVRPKLEDSARRVAPLPSCIMYLPPKKNGKAFIRQLREDEYWKLLFPTFDAGKGELPQDAKDCTGRPLLADWRFQGGAPLRGWPEKVVEGDIVFGAGGDRLKVVWLRSHKFDDGEFAGALSIVRTQENFVEAYGVGVLKGRPETMRLQLERMGSEVIVTATDDGCTRAAPSTACETHVQVFIPRKGALSPIADIPLERRAYAMGSEKGAVGRVEYRLTTAPEFKPGLIKLFEQVMVHDDRGRELRKAELLRSYALTDDGDLKASEGPLWPRIFDTSKTVK